MDRLSQAGYDLRAIQVYSKADMSGAWDSVLLAANRNKMMTGRYFIFGPLAVLLFGLSLPGHAAGIAFAPQGSKLLFVTGGTWTGNLGGLSGADAKCNAEAVARVYTGQYQALLGSAQGRPHTRSKQYSLDYLSSADDVLRRGFLELFTSGPDYAIVEDRSTTWTGLNARGDLAGQDCAAWTSASFEQTGQAGYAEQRGPGEWISGEAFSCNTHLRLYCIEQ